MPILPLEPFVFPTEIFDDCETHREENERWTAVHTRPRAEKALARRLYARGISFFLPLYKRKYRQSGRKLNGYLPLFPGYLFLFGNEVDRIHTLETNMVIRTIFVEDQVQLKADLTQVYRLMESGATVAPEEKLQPGMQVEIVSGPIAGMVGTIIRRNNKTRFAVQVKFLQSAVSAEVEGWMIQPLTTRR